MLVGISEHSFFETKRCLEMVLTYRMRSSISLALIDVASLAQASPLNERNNGGQNEAQKGSQPSVKIQNGTILWVAVLCCTGCARSVMR